MRLPWFILRNDSFVSGYGQWGIGAIPLPNCLMDITAYNHRMLQVFP